MARHYRISDTDLRSILTNKKFNSRTNQYVADCPFCNKSSHLYVDKTTQLFHCKKCDTQGGIYKILRQLNQLELLDGASVTYRDEITSIRMTIRDEESTQSELPVIKLPVGFKVNHTDYLKQRGLSNEEVKRYGIGETNLLSKFRGYVIIPVFDGGEVKGFLGRYGSKKVPNDKLRWNNSRGVNFAGLLYGYDEIITDETQTVVLVEGVFDKIKVDKVLRLHENSVMKCCATFGKKISNQQINKLIDKKITNVILLYDFDAVKEMKSYGLELQKYFVTAITYTTGKDIDEVSDAEAAAVFERLQTPAQFNYNTIRKI